MLALFIRAFVFCVIYKYLLKPRMDAIKEKYYNQNQNNNNNKNNNNQNKRR